MEPVCRIYVPGPPVAWARAGRDGRSGRSYTPTPQRAHAKLIRQYAALSYRARDPLAHTPLALSCIFDIRASANWSKVKLASLNSELMPVITKPDTDNFVKLVTDALEGIVYCDDKAVCLMLCFKRYTREPGTTLSIYDATHPLDAITSMTEGLRQVLLGGLQNG